MNHKDWLDQEYRQWVQALLSSTVHNFKDHPMVRRMLGEIDWPLSAPSGIDLEFMERIDNIGRSVPAGLSGTALRMIHYARQILERQPISILEIGGGAGQFCAVLTAMGYRGEYSIADLPEVHDFQERYLQEVHRQTGLPLLRPVNYERMDRCFCASFYALGEFDDETKAWYVEHVVRKCPHGFVIWNPHSGASDRIDWPCTVRDESPLINPGNKQLEW